MAITRLPSPRPSPRCPSLRLRGPPSRTLLGNNSKCPKRLSASELGTRSALRCLFVSDQGTRSAPNACRRTGRSEHSDESGRGRADQIAPPPPSSPPPPASVPPPL